MITQQTQIKINLPIALKDFLESKASKYGIPIAGYIKYLILKEVEEEEYPTFKMSKRTEKRARQALKDYKEGRAVIVDDIDKFFKEL